MPVRPQKIGSNRALVLSEAFKTNPTRTNLNLENNSVGDIEAQALPEAKTNSNLTTFELQHISVRSGAQVLSEAPKTNVGN
ncbi:hypothetical protein BGZ74_010340 [Mortierella antarctica]|nr:hypothetical protein BGZ74_010340 [Mortierella antarctica]